jgi:hypothetical protein
MPVGLSPVRRPARPPAGQTHRIDSARYWKFQNSEFALSEFKKMPLLCGAHNRLKILMFCFWCSECALALAIPALNSISDIDNSEAC